MATIPARGLQPDGPALNRALRRLATAWHRFWASTRIGASVYLRCLGAARSFIPPSVSQRLRNSLGSVTWPEVAMPALPVRVAGQTSLKLHPHFGEFDLEAVVASRLTYEQEVFEWLEARVGDFDAVVEIGANVGVFTTFFGERFRTLGRSDAQVYAFEPSARAFHRLLENVAANGLENVMAFNVAFAEGRGVHEFFEPAGHLTNGSLVPGFAEQFSSEIRRRWVLAINGVELDRMVPQNARVLLKLDVEGAEVQVLEGLASFIERRHPCMILEVLPGFEDRLMASAPLRTGAFRFFELRATGAVEHDRLTAGSVRDWWLEPR